MAAPVDAVLGQVIATLSAVASILSIWKRKKKK
jgi:hypothetical protein